MHIAIGAGAAIVLRCRSINNIGADVIISVAAVLVGLCFAGSGNFQALLRNEKLRASLFVNHPDGVINYVYTYQMGILVFLFTFIYWVAAKIIFGELVGVAADALKFFGFVLLSMTVREAWSLPLGLAYMNILGSEANDKKE